VSSFCAFLAASSTDSRSFSNSLLDIGSIGAVRFSENKKLKRQCEIWSNVSK
jgi:hypothetical protein